MNRSGQANYTEYIGVVLLGLLTALGLMRMPLALLGLLCVVGCAYLLLRQTEWYLLLALVMNENFFNLISPDYVPLIPSYRNLIFILFFLNALLLLRSEPHKSQPAYFKRYVACFLGLISVAIVVPYFFGGQDFIWGIRASRWFFLLLFYLVFMYRSVDIERLFRLILIAAVIVCLLNNVQYLFYHRLNIFFSDIDTVVCRIGKIRLMYGGTFVIFAFFIALGKYVRKMEFRYLGLAMYFFLTIAIQTKSRMVIAGFILASLIMLFFSTIKKTYLIVLMSLVLVISSCQFLYTHTQFFKKMVQLSVFELAEKTGTYFVRLKAYRFYGREWLKSPIVGKGIWNDRYQQSKYAYEKEKHGLILADIGWMAVLFRFGLLGMIWLMMLYIRLFFFKSPPFFQCYEVMGYLVFSVVTALTLDTVLSQKTILYLAVSLGILERYAYAQQGKKARRLQHG